MGLEKAQHQQVLIIIWISRHHVLKVVFFLNYMFEWNKIYSDEKNNEGTEFAIFVILL